MPAFSYIGTIPFKYRQQGSASYLMRCFSSGAIPNGWKGAKLPSSCNTGGTNFCDFELVATGGGKYQYIPAKIESVDTRIGFIDWVSFTFRVDDFYKAHPFSVGISNDSYDCVLSISLVLEKVFGFGVTSHRLGGGHGYKSRYLIGDNWGYLYIGGNRETVHIQINGQGCIASKRLWRKRLFDFIGLVGAWITRVDVAADFFNGQYNVDSAVNDYKEGKFNLTYKPPKTRQAGDWLFDGGEGRTLYIGNRKNGKELCIYEKGLQLGGAFSDVYRQWNRVELRLANVDRVIPRDILLRSGHYFAGAYPALSSFSEFQSKVKVKKARAKVELSRGLEIAKKQFGKWIYTAAALGMLSSLVVSEIPKRLIVPSHVNQQLVNITEDDIFSSIDEFQAVFLDPS